MNYTYSDGPIARFAARLFWRLPEVFHSALERVTGGWRVVMWTKSDGTTDTFAWECWPENVRPTALQGTRPPRG